MAVERSLALGFSAILAGSLAWGQAGPEPASPPKSRKDQLLALHLAAASTYTIYRDPAGKQRLELRKEPILRWSNPTRSGGQEGDIFLWTDRGRPEVIASIFSHPREGRSERRMCHELHSLSEAVLVVDRQSPNRWTPRRAGVDLAPVPGAPEPAATPAPRGVQLRALARDFAGRSRSEAGENWDLRLLPKPLYRYESTDPRVIDGAVFALVSNAGTDPEIILLLEARKGPEGTRWEYGAARFSDMSLWLTHRGKEVWSAIRGGSNTFNSDADERFRFYQDEIVPEIRDGSPAPKAEAK